MYLAYMGVCVITLGVFLILIKRNEARALEQQYELAYKKHLVDGHVELSEMKKSLTERIGIEGGESSIEQQQQEELLR